MTYPTKPTGNDILSSDAIFADNNNLKSAMTTGEMLGGYNNDGETETDLTSRPDANKFNMFWYQVHKTVNWIVAYIEELFNDKLSKNGGTMLGNLIMNNNKITLTYIPNTNTDAVNKQYVDTAINGSMWLGEVKTLSYPNLPQLPSGVEIVPCDGRAISRTTYASYFALVGTAFGKGDGSTTFNIPDYRGLVIRGWDGNSGRDSGRTFGTIQQSGVPNITGTFPGTEGQYVNSSTQTNSATGAFYKVSSNTQVGSSANNVHDNDLFGIDASRVSSVYKNGLNECRMINSTGYFVVRIK